MKIPEIPQDEDSRLKDLYSYRILDTLAEPEFDELVELASEICNSPISLISLIDRDRQWIKAKKGVDISETPRDLAFCAHTILHEDVFVLEDASADERFNDHPFVTDHLKIRFYAGAPIVTESGHNIGTICLIDDKPKTITARQKRLLSLLAKQAARLMEIRKSNIRIHKQAEEIISLKTKSFRRLMDDYEEHNREISFNLHEDIAQTVASGLIYLRMIKRSHGHNDQYLALATTQFQKALTDIRKMSYAIAPPALKLITVGELVKDFVANISDTFQFHVKLETRNSLETIESKTSMLIIRIIRDWLRLLDAKSNASHVNIFLSVSGQLELSIADNGYALTLAEREKLAFEDGFFDKIAAFDGRLQQQTDGTQNLFSVALPVSIEIAGRVKTGL